MKNLLHFRNLQQIRFARLQGVADLYFFNIPALHLLEIDSMRDLTYVNIINCPSLVRAHISNSRLDDFFVQNCQAIQYLDLSHNRLEAVPNMIFEITGLQQLSLADNRITSVDDEVEKLQNLRSLDLSNNAIRTLKASLGRCTQLQQLNITGNMIIRPGPQIQKKGTAGILQFLRAE